MSDGESIETDALTSALHIVECMDSPFVDDETLVNWIKNAIIDAVRRTEIRITTEHNQYYRKNIEPKLQVPLGPQPESDKK